MIKALLLALSMGTFLTYLDAKVLPKPYGHRSNVESYRIQKQSTLNAEKVSIWLNSAKNNIDSAMESLKKSKAPNWLRGMLKEAEEALDKVNTTSSESFLNDLWDALFLGARALNDMLSKYNTTGEGLSEAKFLNAKYHVTGACIDLVTALGEAIGNPTLRASVSDTAKILQKELLSASDGTEFLNRTLELAKKVLEETENHNYVQSTV